MPADCGLTPDVITRIFTMFTQVESDLGRLEGGLGIGLALAKGLRINPAASSSDPAGAPEQRMQRRILIVDDNWDGAET
jgi:signal transduction histidine kinase